MTGKVIILAAGSVIISFLLSREIVHKPVRSVINAVYLLGIFLIFGMVSGIFGIRPALSSLWILTVFLHLAVYYSILLCADSLLRKRYSPNLLVILWLLSCVLFFIRHMGFPVLMPAVMIPLPNTVLNVLYVIWICGFLFLGGRSVIEHLQCWRQAILTILRQIKSTNLSQLIMTKHNSHSLSAVT